MARNQVRVLQDVSIDPYEDGVNLLHLQWCRYELDGGDERGYRFMWSAEGRLKPLRGGARIPSWNHLQALLKKAESQGWANQDEQNV